MIFNKKVHRNEGVDEIFEYLDISTTLRISGILILIGIGSYIVRFWKNDWSADPESWSIFATYVGLFVSIANVLFFLVLTMEIHRSTEKNNDRTQRIEENRNKPILTCETITKSVTKDFTQKILRLKNKGAGLALDVKIFYRDEVGSAWEHNKFSRFALGVEEEKSYGTLAYKYCTLIVYSDILGNQYVSVYANQETRFRHLTNPHSPINPQDAQWPIKIPSIFLDVSLAKVLELLLIPPPGELDITEIEDPIPSNQ